MSSIAFFKDMCIKSVPLVKIYNAARSDYPMNNRGRSHHGLIFPLIGAEKFYFRDKTIKAEPSTVLYIPKGEAYRIELDDEKSSVICIDFEIYGETDLRPAHFSAFETHNMRSLFYEANSTWAKNSPWRDPTAKALIYQIISALISGQNARSENQKKLAPALSYLHGHYTDPDFCIEKLAQTAGIGRRYFEKLFFAETGSTPRDYVIGLKIALARELLHNEKLSTADVAYELGYSDVYHFSKIFKQKTGISPGKYKRT